MMMSLLKYYCELPIHLARELDFPHLALILMSSNRIHYIALGYKSECLRFQSLLDPTFQRVITEMF